MFVLTALLFAVSGAMLVWFTANQFMEKQIVADRLRALATSYFRHVGPKTDFLKIDFSEQKSAFRSFIGFKFKPTPLQATTFVVSWIVASIFIFAFLKVPLGNKLLLVMIVSILVPRVIEIMAKRRRIQKIQIELPGAMDLIVICLEAGLGLSAAFLRVATELEGSPLGKELRQTFNEVGAGIPLDLALKNFARRSSVPDINAVVAAIIQSQKMGTAIAMTFRVQADSMREKYKMRMREQIAKIPIKILFPLVFFIFPALFVVILGPGFISIMTSFLGKG